VTKPRPAEFKWRQFEPQLILLAEGWYLRFSLSYRDVEELLQERGMSADHVTVWRWVQRYAPEVDRRLLLHLKPTNKSWRVDETYIRVKGKWTYLYRAVDSADASIDFLLSAQRDGATAKRLFQQALCSPNHPTPRVINVDKNPSYPPVVEALKSEGTLWRRCRLRPIRKGQALGGRRSDCPPTPFHRWAVPDCNLMRRRHRASRVPPLESCNTALQLGPPSNLPESVIHANQE
jgi:IS6 family transposase